MTVVKECPARYEFITYKDVDKDDYFILLQEERKEIGEEKFVLDK